MKNIVKCNFGRGYYEEHFNEIILNLDQWFRSCCLKYFSSRALAAILISGAEPFRHCNFGRGP